MALRAFYTATYGEDLSDTLVSVVSISTPRRPSVGQFLGSVLRDLGGSDLLAVRLFDDMGDSQVDPSSFGPPPGNLQTLPLRLFLTQIVLEGLSSAPFHADAADVANLCTRIWQSRVPVAASPLEGVKLSELVAAGTGMGAGGIGTFVAFQTYGPTPMAIFVGAGALILFGAAAGISRGLNAGLEDAIRRVLAHWGPRADE